jgi:hypothetical protein
MNSQRTIMPVAAIVERSPHAARHQAVVCEVMLGVLAVAAHGDKLVGVQIGAFYKEGVKKFSPSMVKELKSAEIYEYFQFSYSI